MHSCCMQVHQHPAAATCMQLNLVMSCVKYFHTHILLLPPGDDVIISVYHPEGGDSKTRCWNNIGCGCSLINCDSLCVCVRVHVCAYSQATGRHHLVL